mmetsp:Transcript_10667/g.44110  ORF Transcript_10667/g.44110 Transcript_10667/m.44110 type:complete len:345 (-) Transcript_10667:784-1818(-)
MSTVAIAVETARCRSVLEGATVPTHACTAAGGAIARVCARIMRCAQCMASYARLDTRGSRRQRRAPGARQAVDARPAGPGPVWHVHVEALLAEALQREGARGVKSARRVWARGLLELGADDHGRVQLSCHGLEPRRFVHLAPDHSEIHAVAHAHVPVRAHAVVEGRAKSHELASVGACGLVPRVHLGRDVRQCHERTPGGVRNLVWTRAFCQARASQLLRAHLLILYDLAAAAEVILVLRSSAKGGRGCGRWRCDRTTGTIAGATARPRTSPVHVTVGHAAVFVSTHIVVILVDPKHDEGAVAHELEYLAASGRRAHVTGDDLEELAQHVHHSGGRVAHGERRE